MTENEKNTSPGIVKLRSACMETALMIAAVYVVRGYGLTRSGGYMEGRGRRPNLHLPPPKIQLHFNVRTTGQKP